MHDTTKIKSGPLLPLRGIFPRKRGKQRPSWSSVPRKRGSKGRPGTPFPRLRGKVPRRGGWGRLLIFAPRTLRCRRPRGSIPVDIEQPQRLPLRIAEIALQPVQPLELRA